MYDGDGREAGFGYNMLDEDGNKLESESDPSIATLTEDKIYTESMFSSLFGDDVLMELDLDTGHAISPIKSTKYRMMK